MSWTLLSKAVTFALIAYFWVSGMNAMMGLDAKLARIGLAATTQDGKMAFMLIYSGLMIGVGLSMCLLWWISKSTLYSLIIAVTIIASFVVFRLIGAVMVDEFSQVQVKFIVIELIEVLIIGCCLAYEARLRQQPQ